MSQQQTTRKEEVVNVFQKCLNLIWSVLLICICAGQGYAQTYSFTVESKPLLYLPFEAGTVVNVPQGNNGTFTHKGKYAYAYDFDMGDTQNNSNNEVFGVAVMSPVNGVVVSSVFDKTDFSCSGSTCNGGWGNTVIIKPDGVNYFLRLNHLKKNSVPAKFRNISASAPVRVKQGEKVGEVGSTGISTHPHLDMSLVTAYGTTNYNTIEFDFVEGPAHRYSWLVSELEPDKYILDNNARVNLGAEVEYIGSYTNTANWSSYTLPSVTSYNFDFTKVYYDGSGLHGSNFYYTFQYQGWYAWQFKVLSSTPGDMLIEANCYNSRTQMSPSVRYWWFGSVKSHNLTVSQAETNSNTYPMEHTSLFYNKYISGAVNTVYAQNMSDAGKAMCVDSLVVYLFKD